MKPHLYPSRQYPGSWCCTDAKKVEPYREHCAPWPTRILLPAGGPCYYGRNQTEAYLNWSNKT